MKKSILTIIAMLLPLPAWAAIGSCTQDSLAKQALNTSATAGPYVQLVLQRVEKGITKARGADAVNITDEYRSEWLPRLSSAMNQIVDSEIALTQEQEALFEQTACAAMDAAILEATIEEVRCELNKAYEAGQVGALPLLIDLIGFTADRYKNFLAGYLDPLVEDASWHRIYSFDDPAVLGTKACLVKLQEDSPTAVCAEMDAKKCAEKGGIPYLSVYGCMANGHQRDPAIPLPNPKEGLCPFFSDYLPPMAGGYKADTLPPAGNTGNTQSSGDQRVPVSYGCDLQTAAAKGVYGPVAAEMQALQVLLKDRDAFIKGMGDLGGAVSLIPQGLNSPDLTHFGSTISEKWEHHSFKGCFHQILADKSMEETIAKIPGMIRSSASSQTNSIPTEAGLSNLLYQLGLTRYEPRDPFSFNRNESAIMKHFVELRATWGLRRPATETLVQRAVSPFAMFDTTNLLDAIMRGKAVETLNYRSLQQAILDSVATAKIVDAPIRLSRAMAPVQEGSAELGTLARDLNTGMRNFARGLAWFLLRSCLGRPGAAELGTVIKIVLSDACFPYTDGTFLSNMAVHEACKNAANK